MGDFYNGGLVNSHVYPTELDHHGSGAEGIGSSVMETYLCATMLGHMPWTGVVKSGFTVPTSGSGLNFNIPVGEAILLGHRINGPTPTENVNCDFTASATNYVYLVLEYDASIRVIRPIITINTTGTKPPNSILLGTVTFNATPAITAYTDARFMGRASWGVWSTLGQHNLGSKDWTPGTYKVTLDYTPYPCAVMLINLVATAGTAVARRISSTEFEIIPSGATPPYECSFVIFT